MFNKRLALIIIEEGMGEVKRIDRKSTVEFLSMCHGLTLKELDEFVTDKIPDSIGANKRSISERERFDYYTDTIRMQCCSQCRETKEGDKGKRYYAVKTSRWICDECKGLAY